MKNELKIENLFKRFHQLARQFAANRLLLYKTIGSLLVVLAVSTAGYFAFQAWQGTESVEAADNPIAWWKFEEQSGTTAYDSSGNGYNSTLGGDGAGTDLPVWIAGGKTGGALSFDGSDDYLSVPGFGFTNFTIGMWVKLGAATGYRQFFFAGEDDTSRITWYRNNVTAQAYYQVNDANGAANPLYAAYTHDMTTNAWNYITLVVDGTTSRAYTNGQQKATYTNASFTGVVPADLSAQTFYIGTYYTVGDGFYYPLQGAIDEFKIYNYALTANQVTERYIGTKPVAYWNFDEGYASTTYDRVGNNDGTLVSNTQWVEGKFGKALSFDGTDDYLTFSTVPYNQTRTFSIWYKAASATNQAGIIGNNTDSTLNFTANVCGGIFLMNGTIYGTVYSAGAYQTVSMTARLNEWQHAVFIRDIENQKISLYLDADSVGETSFTAASLGVVAGTNYCDNNGFKIARHDSSHASGPSGYFKGVLDEPKIYPRALEPNEITALYQSTGESAGSLQAGTGDNYNANLVGYWKFDETTAWGATAGAVKDSSGLNNNGTATNAVVSSAVAKFGNSGYFDGNGDYLTIANSSSLQQTRTAFTVAAWVYDTSFSDYGAIVEQWYPDTGWMLSTMSSGKLNMNFLTSDDSFSNEKSNTPLTANAWNHVVMQYDGSEVRAYVNGALDFKYTMTGTLTTGYDNDVYIGSNAGDSPFSGYIDDVKIWKTALTSDQIMREYVSGPAPVGYWKFEEQSGQSVYDSSGFTPAGTFGANTNVATDDPSWVMGSKVGGGVKFDGSDDYVLVGDAASLRLPFSFTVQHWVNFKGLPSASTYTATISKGLGTSETAGSNMNYDMTVDNGLTNAGYNFAAGYETSAGTDVVANWKNSGITTNRWYHAVMTRDGASGLLSFYVDGLLRATTTNATAPDTGSDALEFGDNLENLSAVGVYFNGLLDEVKIYNYARTTRHIMDDFNGGAPVAHWAFDEGYASTTADGSGNGYTLSFYGSGYSPSWVTNGKVGKAASFMNYNGQFGQFAQNTALAQAGADLKLNETLTFETWINPDATQNSGNGAGVIWANSVPGYYSQYYISLVTGTSAGNYRLILGFQNTSDTYYNSYSKYFIPTSVWSHLAITCRWQTSCDIYSNGKFIETIATVYSNGRDDQTTFEVGGTVGAYSGIRASFDDMKIYNYARTAEEIRQDYASGGGSISGQTTSAAFGTKRNSASTWDDGGFGGAAPVAHWKFEEQSGTSAYDSMGGLNNGTVTNAIWTKSGKVGGALKFDGSGDYVVLGSSGIPTGNTHYTLQAWIKPSAMGVYGIIGWGAWGTGTDIVNALRLTATGVVNYWWNNDLNSANVSLADGQWHHVVAKFDGTTRSIYIDGVYSNSDTPGSGHNVAASDVAIGRTNTTEYFWGSIDEVKIYNYARSAAQTAFDYNGGKPLAHWKFDEGSGVTTRDSSGRAATLTMYPRTGGTNTATSSMWVTGKVAKALSFDGTDDVAVNLSYDWPTLPSASVFSWIKTTDTAGVILEKMHVNTAYSPGALTFGISSSKVWVGGYAGGCTYPTNYYTLTGNGTVSDNAWHQIGVVYDSSAMTFYIDGVLDKAATSVTTSGDICDNTNGVIVGESRYYDAATLLAGYIDDLRVYNYPRSSEQVKQDYNNGAGVKF